MANVLGRKITDDRAIRKRIARKQTIKKRPLRKRTGADQSLLSEFAGFLVRRVWQIHVAMFLDATSGSNLTPVKFSILLVLRDHPNLEQVTLGAQVGIDRSNLAEILARMTIDGLVKTTPSANDRRSKLAALTKRGLNVLEQNENRVLQTHARLLEDLLPNQRRDFMDMLDIIVTAKNDLGRARYSTNAPTA